MVSIAGNNSNDMCSGWAEHFHKLATPVNSGDYDNIEYNQVQYDVLTLQHMIHNDDPIVKQYTESQVMKTISKLNLGKAPHYASLEGKNIKSDPYSYRGITVTPVVSKVVEVLMKEELEHVLWPTQNKLHHGYTPGMCPLACAVLLQELLLEAKATKLEHCEALLDAKSAFDAVYQNSLSCSW